MTHDQIANLMLLEMRPEVFHWIEFRRVRRQRFNDQLPLGIGNEVFDCLAAVDGSAIPQDQKRHTQVSQQSLEELHHLPALDGAGMDLKIEVPKRHSGNDRQALPAKGLLNHWRLSAWCPCSHAVGTRAQSAFVDEYDGAPFLAGFFFNLGKVVCFQKAIFCSLRSMARRVGRWQLNPKDRNRCQTWPG